MSICYSKQVAQIECTTTEGIDGNLRKLNVGDGRNVVQYDLSKALDIAENSHLIMRSFKHNDVRVRRMLYGKYGKRRKTSNYSRLKTYAIFAECTNTATNNAEPIAAG